MSEESIDLDPCEACKWMMGFFWNKKRKSDTHY